MALFIMFKFHTHHYLLMNICTYVHGMILSRCQWNDTLCEPRSIFLVLFHYKKVLFFTLKNYHHYICCWKMLKMYVFIAQFGSMSAKRASIDELFSMHMFVIFFFFYSNKKYHWIKCKIPVRVYHVVWENGFLKSINQLKFHYICA